MTRAVSSEGKLTHFEGRESEAAEGGFDEHKKFPRPLSKKHRAFLAEMAPNNLYNDWYITLHDIGGGDYRIAAKCAIQGTETPEDLKLTVAGNAAEKAATLALFAERFAAMLGAGL